MNTATWSRGVGRLIADRLADLPIIGPMVRTRGWPYVLTWLHRITGLLLFLYLLLHILTLTGLQVAGRYDNLMQTYSGPVFAFFEWLLAVPVVFHALNGGRLILFEIWGVRDDEAMIRWVVGLSVVYVFLVAFFMITGDQVVSPLLYWLVMLVFGIAFAYAVAVKTTDRGHAPTWRLQRVSGAFLLVMIPAHMVFMHLNPETAGQANMVVSRLKNNFIRIVDLVLVAIVFYHAAYGLTSLARDYFSAGPAQKVAVCLAVLISTIFAVIGIKLLINV